MIKGAPKPFAKLFAILIVTIGAALAVAVVLQANIYNRAQIAIERSLSYDIAWTGVNGRLEMANLRTWVAKYGVTRDPGDAKVARLYFNILKSRIETWAAGGFGAFVGETARRQARFSQVRDWVSGLEDEFERLDKPGAFEVIAENLENASKVMDLIGGQAHIASVKQAGEMRQQLHWHSEVQRVLVIASIAISAALLAFLTIQNRILRHSRAGAEAHARHSEYVARHDHLTGLPNRLAFCDHLSDAIDTLQPHKGHIGLLALDLDGFKAINDALGHAAGDELLVSVARRLTDRVKGWDANNIVSRFGGDEFVVLLNVKGGPEGIRCKAEHLVHIMQVPHSVAGGQVIVNSSVGYALAGKESSQQTLMLNADLALSAAKARGKAQVVAYHPDMRTEYERRGQIERDLIKASVNGDIYPVYQVQVDMLSGQPLAVEALARWHHAELGEISPGEFIPIAEASGRVFDVGLAILQQACAEAVHFPDEVSLSVNLSVAQLARDDLISVIRDILNSTGLAPERLKLEVTETVLMRDRERSVAMLNRLKELGVRIALDDFGTGYSALSYLREFDWDELKIDKRFVNSVARDSQSLAIIRALLDLARELGVSVIVEGIETAEQHHLLHEMGCATGQGFLYGRGVPAEELAGVFLNCLTLAKGWDADHRSSKRIAQQHSNERKAAEAGGGGAAG